jgi:hypothetical protein
MDTADWMIASVSGLLAVGFLWVMFRSFFLQQKATTRDIPRSLELQEQAVRLAEETARLQQEANALLLDISQKLGRDQPR